MNRLTKPLASILIPGAAVLGIKHFGEGSIIATLAIFTVGMYCLIRAADLFTDFSLELGNRFGISPLGAGALIIAIGTSAPEVFASLSAALRDQPEMAIGNVLGTVVANTLLGIGVAAVVARKPMDVHIDVLGIKIPVFFGSLFLVAAAFYDNVLDRLDGSLLLIFLGFYLHNTIKRSRVTRVEGEVREPGKYSSLGILAVVVVLLISLGTLFLSGDWIVDSVLKSSEHFGFSSVKMATTVVAIGTSIPELATAVILVLKNEHDTLFGEIIGSNIFDLVGIFGICAFVTPLTMSGELLWFLIGAVLVGLFLLTAIVTDRKVGRVEGVLFILLFIQFNNILIGL